MLRNNYDDDAVFSFVTLRLVGDAAGSLSAKQQHTSASPFLYDPQRIRLGMLQQGQATVTTPFLDSPSRASAGVPEGGEWLATVGRLRTLFELNNIRCLTTSTACVPNGGLRVRGAIVY